MTAMTTDDQLHFLAMSHIVMTYSATVEQMTGEDRCLLCESIGAALLHLGGVVMAAALDLPVPPEAYDVALLMRRQAAQRN